MSEGENGPHASLWVMQRIAREAPPVMKLTRKSQLIAAAAISASAIFFAAARAANAGLLVKSATDCTSPSASQPFSKWYDNSSYILAPQGSFENGTSDWSLSGASLDSGNESYNVAHDNGSHSLKIKPGGSALTRTICVGLDRPTL